MTDSTDEEKVVVEGTDWLLTSDEKVTLEFCGKHSVHYSPDWHCSGCEVDKAVEKTLRAVGEWGDTFCVVYEHYGSDKAANTRKRECRRCWQELKQGKMPE